MIEFFITLEREEDFEAFVRSNIMATDPQPLFNLDGKYLHPMRVTVERVEKL